MLYRWGFIEEGSFVECSPVVDDDTALDFAQETGQIFYRAKLNGSLAFRFEFDAILAKGYNYTHIIVLQWFDNADNTWKECWRGHFALTDCEIDYDTNTISVQPATQDRYTEILEGYDIDYNLVKLSAKMQPVSILIRPCTQIYLAGNTRISNYVGGNSWDAECEMAAPTQLHNGRWKQLRNCAWFRFKYTTGQYAGKTAVYFGRFVMADEPGAYYDVTFPADGRIYNSDGTYVEDILQCRLHHTGSETKWEFDITDSDNNEIMRVWYDLISDDYGDSYWNYEEGGGIEDGYFRWDRLYGRTICQSDLASVTIGGTAYDLYDIADMDIAGNYNYNKFIEYVAAEIYPSIDTSADPTGWPESAEGRYFVKPQNTLTRKYFPIAAESWNSVSYWFYAAAVMETIETLLIATRTIRDGYELRFAVMRLMQKANWQGDYFISGILGGSQDYAGYRFLPVITAKSNVISSYYDSPAQNAPISLMKIFSMLRQAYRIYWYIDSNNNIHVEHISYFDNGNSYVEDEPELLVDLTAKTHTRTTESKVFGQNKVKYEKDNMPSEFTFAWMDKQTMAFQGFPIKCLDAYVQKGAKEDNNIGDFDTDVDFILTAPSEVSKDGFVLFALPPVGNDDYATQLRIETLRLIDENGDEYELKVQNAEGAFAKIHEHMWRYDLPCENVMINNAESTAITTGRYKLQTIEFADEVMAEVLKDISNCIKPIRTQQGDGHIKTLSINLNSLTAKADLLFNFIGRWYYLRGTALGNSITIFVNGESTTIEVSANTFKYRYNTPITALTFNGADVISVNLADCDNLDGLTSAANMFKNCSELVAVDFGNKKLGAVTDATDMFAGCAQLSTLICPATSTWKPDLNFEDCPLLTTESIYSLIEYLFIYESGSHTLTFNQTMWNALDPSVQTDIETKANAKGWQIGMAAAYFISGTSSASVVHATINGDAVEIDVEGGLFNYGYRSPITSISFEADTNVTTIDFSLSDGLSGLTSLDNCFKNCSSLVSVNFTNCDISNVASASDCFANCAALTNLTIPAGTWKADVDFSFCPLITYAEMLDIIGGLFTYTSGVHTITWNTMYWDNLTQAQQQTISDAADAKGWQTNAVAVVYVVRGTSSNVNGTETFNIQFIDDDSLTPSAAETITCAVDGNGNWEYEYSRKKIYTLSAFASANTTILSVDFTDADDFERCIGIGGSSLTAYGAFYDCTNLQSVTLNKNLQNVLYARGFVYGCSALTTLNLTNATFASLTMAREMLRGCSALTTLNLPNATFASATDIDSMLHNCNHLTTLNLPIATFANVTTAQNFMNNCAAILSIDLSVATFASATNMQGAFKGCTNVQTINLSVASFSELEYGAAMFNNCTHLTNIVWSANLNFDKLKYIGVSNQDEGIFQNCAFTTIDLTEQSFKNVEVAVAAFYLPSCTSIKLPNATFENLTNAQVMFIGKSANNPCTEIDLSSATFEKVTNSYRMFERQHNLTTFKCPPLSKAMALTAPTSAYGAFNFANSPLTYQSMLNIANWVRDFTGYSAHTCTFKTSAWNALSAAEQATIQGILQGKNWNLATA